MRFRSKPSAQKPARILFVTDLHGSEICFRKFLNAAPVYGAETLIVGGDICGKFLVPVLVDEHGRGTADLWGETFMLESEEEFARFERRVADNGAYAVRLDQARFEELSSDPALRDQVFEEAVLERVRQWVALAEERLAPNGIKLYMTAGNDDPWDVDEVLRGAESDAIVAPDRRVVRMADGTELLTLGYANHTPWNCPRDKPEEELAHEIERLVGELEDPESAIFSLHVPPFASGLDNGPKLDETLKPAMGMMGVETVPVGSTAVREAIERYGPRLSLHGHIHESRGVAQIGRTIAINPGSEYGEGILRGLIVDWDRAAGSVEYQFTAG
ncbi:MAG: metallophosphoesterase family protein [Solirubrobacteraceae bacterium]